MRPHNAILEEHWFGPSTRSALWNNIPDNLEDGRLTNVGMYSMFNSVAAMCRGDSETTLSVMAEEIGVLSEYYPQSKIAAQMRAIAPLKTLPEFTTISLAFTHEAYHRNPVVPESGTESDYEEKTASEAEGEEDEEEEVEVAAAEEPLEVAPPITQITRPSQVSRAVARRSLAGAAPPSNTLSVPEAFTAAGIEFTTPLSSTSKALAALKAAQAPRPAPTEATPPSTAPAAKKTQAYCH